uniref:Uncharacterized protein n=1 Tax=Anguilla anguilla TaxID=7936 RepID=A0A0E9RT58_ANGAN
MNPLSSLSVSPGSDTDDEAFINKTCSVMIGSFSPPKHMMSSWCILFTSSCRSAHTVPN